MRAAEWLMRPTFGIGARVALVGMVGVAGMMLVGAGLIHTMERLESTSALVERSQRVATRIGDFNHTLGRARIEFETFRNAPAKLSIDSTEALLQIAAGRLRRLDEDAAGTPLAQPLSKLHEMMATVADSVRRIAPPERRSGSGSIDNLRLVLEDRVEQLTLLRNDLRVTQARPAEAVAELALAGKIADILALASESEKKPEAGAIIAMAGEIADAEALAAKATAKPDRPQAALRALKAMDAAFTNWIEGAAAMRNDTSVAAGVFDIVAPVVTKLIEENGEAAAEAREQTVAIKRQIRSITLAALALGLLIAAFAAWRIGLGITRPIAAIRGAMERLAAGAVDETIPHAERRDEIGSMARSVQVFQAAMLERQRLTDSQLEVASAQGVRSRVLGEAIGAFDGALTQAQGQFAASSADIGAFAGSLAEMARALDDSSRAAVDAVANTAQQSASVAAATEELQQSIAEIGQHTHRANAAVQEAVAGSNASQTRMLALKERAAEISSIVDIINTIAAQTNLLALNATIEAARAGEAGRGFAVVAHEIKALASQTAGATAEIGRQIAAIQSAASESAGAVGALGGLLSSAEEAAVSVAAAAQQQDQSVAEIARIMSTLSGDAGLARDAAARAFAETERATAMGESLRVLSVRIAEATERFERDAQGFVKAVRAA